MTDGIRVLVGSEAAVMAACRQARQLAEALGFGRCAAYHVATAASELAANLLIHAGGGVLEAHPVQDPEPPGHRRGLELLAVDQGPGIPDLALALAEGYSTGSGLGCGLPGVRRLMDTLVIQSTPGQGTQVRATKWLPRP